MDYDKSNTSFISTVVWTFGLAALAARASVAGCDHTRDHGMDRRQLLARGGEPPRPAKEPCSWQDTQGPTCVVMALPPRKCPDAKSFLRSTSKTEFEKAVHAFLL